MSFASLFNIVFTILVNKIDFTECDEFFEGTIIWKFEIKENINRFVFIFGFVYAF